ncbi:dihydroneopterin aldolase [Aliidiomarina sanyensis]|uniref:7,8-dihydroneopterin aldolase n=2 Tax=Aliidiomarina sanyensis TaxID=1249555 RepID=A0A432WBM3_9GAMM|nr:dihydroneopterin aldolase [Aliidiomarina sanyensis]
MPDSANDFNCLLNSDHIAIEGLEVAAVIGVFDWEKEIKQPLFIDLMMAWPNRVPAASGELTDALDYDRVSRAVTQWIQARPYGLIEEVAEMIAEQVCREFGVALLRVKVAKPTAIESARSVSVTITRRAGDSAS